VVEQASAKKQAAGGTAVKRRVRLMGSPPPSMGQ
jgi:hypothetical protein